MSNTNQKAAFTAYSSIEVNAIVALIVPLLLRADAYKGEHWHATKEDVAFSQLYLEPRKGDMQVQVAGMREIANTLTTRITPEMVEYVNEFAKHHSGGAAHFNYEGWMRVATEMDGRLPVELKALREGDVIKAGSPIAMLRNTVEGFGWIPPYFEDVFLRGWKTCSVATKSMRQKAVLYKFAKETIDEEFINMWLPYALHDFGPRSTGTSEESAVSGGQHLLNFSGSDNWEATYRLMQVYSIPMHKMPSGSVFAIEHNNVLSYGREQEFELFAKLAKEILTEGRIGSVLIDTYDIDKAITWFCQNAEQLRQWWEEGDCKGRVVLRPDSGDAVEVPIMVLTRLMNEGYGYSVNGKGFKVLPSYIGCIQGDGTNEKVIDTIRIRMTNLKMSAINIVFGQGGELIANHKRDDMYWASKVSSITNYEGEHRGCSKCPIGDTAKKTKEGFFKAVNVNGETVWESSDSWEDSGLYVSYFRNGEHQNFYDWEVTKAFAHQRFLECVVN